jgi:hypothetical protein
MGVAGALAGGIGGLVVRANDRLNPRGPSQHVHPQNQGSYPLRLGIKAVRLPTDTGVDLLAYRDFVRFPTSWQRFADVPKMRVNRIAE